MVNALDNGTDDRQFEPGQGNIFSCKGKKNNCHLKIMLANTNKALYVRNIVTLRVTKKICCGLASSERSEVLAKPNRFFLSLLKLQYF